MYPKAIQKLIHTFTRLPGIGPKTAERLVLYLLDNHIHELRDALSAVTGNIRKCTTCRNFSIENECTICTHPKRSKNIIAVVEKPQDIIALEKSGEFEGVYHVLGGLISPIRKITPDKLAISELLHRIQTNDQPLVTEVLLAFDSNVEGDTTAQYIMKQLEKFKVTVTKLARGLPVGSDVEYADEVTLKDAIKYRQEIKSN